MRKNLKMRLLSILVMAVMLLMIPASTFAASSPYRDVTRETVEGSAYKAISYVKKHQGYKNVIRGKEFHPDQKITRAEFLQILGNFYGKKNIRVNLNDVIKGQNGITEKYVINRLVKLATGHFKVAFGWAYGSGYGYGPGGQSKPKTPKLTRAEAAELLYAFAKCDKKFRPRK